MRFDFPTDNIYKLQTKYKRTKVNKEKINNDWRMNQDRFWREVHTCRMTGDKFTLCGF